MKQFFSLLAILLISTQSPALSKLIDPGDEEDEFWSSYAKSDFKTAGELSEKLSEINIDYLFLSAVCDFNQYSYNSYNNKSDRFYLKKNSDYSSLKALLEKHYRKDRHELDNLMGIVQFLIPSTNLGSAREFFERSIALEEYNPVAYNFLALVHIQEGNYDRALELARISISLDSGYPEPYNTLALAWFRKGHPLKAMDKLLDGMIICPVNSNDTYANFIRVTCENVTFYIGDTTLRVPGFRTDELRDHTLGRLKGHNRPLLDLAFQFYSFQSYPEVDSVLKVISVDSTIQGKYYFLSILNGLEMGDTARFKKGLETMVGLNESEALLDLASYLYKSGDLERSRKVLIMLESIPISSEIDMKVQSNLGAVEMQLGNYKEAVKYLKKALKKSKGDMIALSNLGISYYKLDKSKKAKHYLLKAMEYCESTSQKSSVEYWLNEIEKAKE